MVEWVEKKCLYDIIKLLIIILVDGFLKRKDVFIIIDKNEEVLLSVRFIYLCMKINRNELIFVWKLILKEIFLNLEYVFKKWLMVNKRLYFCFLKFVLILKIGG